MGKLKAVFSTNKYQNLLEEVEDLKKMIDAFYFKVSENDEYNYITWRINNETLENFDDSLEVGLYTLTFLKRKDDERLVKSVLTHGACLLGSIGFALFTGMPGVFLIILTIISILKKIDDYVSDFETKEKIAQEIHTAKITNGNSKMFLKRKLDKRVAKINKEKGHNLELSPLLSANTALENYLITGIWLGKKSDEKCLRIMLQEELQTTEKDLYVLMDMVLEIEEKAKNVAKTRVLRKE